MGKRRQGEAGERGRSDDGQEIRSAALEQSDRDQYEDEGLAHSHPVMSARPGPGEVRSPGGFREDQLDNQDPSGQHAVPVSEQPQAMHSQARVGQGLSPGVELGLEAADVPLTPHSPDWHGSDRGERAD
jgi:hypothetical protein